MNKDNNTILANNNPIVKQHIVDLENLIEVAIKATYTKVRLLLIGGKGKAIRDKANNIIDRDGSRTGGNDFLLNLLYMANTCQTSKYVEYLKSIEAHEAEPTAESLAYMHKCADEYQNSTANEFDDLVGFGNVALFENITRNNGEADSEAFKEAFKAVERAIYAENKHINYKRLYIDMPTVDDEGNITGWQIVCVNDGITQLLEGIIINDTIQEAKERLTPYQVKILNLYALDRTYEAIGRACGVSKQAIAKQIKAIREACKDIER